MDRDPRSRRAASASVSGRGGPAKRPAGSRSQHSQPNPQRPGYAAGDAGRRAAAAQRRRQRRTRTVLGVILVLLVLALGIVLSVNLLFKVTTYRITDMNGDLPADLGVYTEAQVLEVLGVAKGDNLFGFSAAAKSEQLAAQLPYLDEVEVKVSLPGTVVVRVRPATERFAVALPAGWLVLSDQLKVLRTAAEEPEGLIMLEAALPAVMPGVAGQFLKLETYNSLTAAAAAEDGVLLPAPAATPVPGEVDANEALRRLTAGLDETGLLPGVTGISVADMNDIWFRYEDRLRVILGTVHDLDDKLKLSAATILDVEGQGLGATDRGVLDVSYQRSDGEIWAYLRPEGPEPTPTPEPEGGSDANGLPPSGEAAAAGD